MNAEFRVKSEEVLAVEGSRSGEGRGVRTAAGDGRAVGGVRTAVGGVRTAVGGVRTAVGGVRTAVEGGKTVGVGRATGCVSETEEVGNGVEVAASRVVVEELLLLFGD